MAMVDDRRSRLNPNAPIFVPYAAFSEVEDFSKDWWELVKTSPRFRDFWLSQYEENDFIIPSFAGYDSSDLDEFVDSKDSSQKGTEPLKGGIGNGMDAKALLKKLNLVPKSPVGPAKYCGKKLANKCVMSKVSSSPKYTATRRIYQPRR